VAAQAAVIVELRAVIVELQGRVAELERQLDRHSRNSSKPPSSDGLGKPATPARQRRGGGRKPGKQPGAPGAHLARVDDPDEVVVHVPERCRGCGADLVLAPVVGVAVRQVFDLPEIRLRRRASGRAAPVRLRDGDGCRVSCAGPRGGLLRPGGARAGLLPAGG